MNELTEDQLERIDSYLAGDLDAHERKTVASLIINDAKWREAHAFRVAVREASKSAFQQSMRKKFSEVDQVRGQRRTLQPIWLAVAACGALLISAVLWLFPGQESNSLLAEYRTFPNIVLPIEKSGAEFTMREKAYHAYELGQYAQAISFFTNLDSLQTADRLYLGLSYLESQQFAEAGKLLDEVRATSNPRWSQVADWYQAWSFLKQERKADAIDALTHITSISEHRYQADAAAVLKKLTS